MAYESAVEGVTVDSSVSAIKTGGATGQVLAKKSDNDYDTEWVDQAASPGQSDYVTFNPTDAASVPVLTLFVDSADNSLKFKTLDGTVYVVGLAPGA